MSIATIYFYDIVKFVHVAAVVVAFGPTFGYAFFQTLAERTNPHSVPSVMRAMGTIDRLMVVPGMILILAAGIYLTADRWDFGDFFVGVGIVAILVLFGLAHGFFLRAEKRMAALAERDIAAAGQGEVRFSDEYLALSKRTGQIGTLAGLIVLVAIFFMVVKP